MNAHVEKSVLLYCDNFLALKKPLYWKATYEYIKLCALSYTFEDSLVDPDILLHSINYIKDNTRWFSYLRSSKVYSAAYLTAGRRNIEIEFPKLMNCYDAMKQAGFSSSNYLPIAAYALYATTPSGSEYLKAQTAKLIYDAMKRQHPFLTATDDYASAVILASSNKSIDELINEAERTYSLLKNSGLHSGNGLQFISQILAFDPSSPEEKTNRCIGISNYLKQHKNRVSTMYYGTIGFLALTGDRWQEAVNEALEAAMLIKERKCASLGEKEFCLMIASALICKEYLSAKNSPGSEFLRIGLGATVEAIIAAQIATCAAFAAAASASSSSST